MMCLKTVVEKPEIGCRLNKRDLKTTDDIGPKTCCYLEVSTKEQKVEPNT